MYDFQKMNNKIFNLEERLIDFACSVIKIAESLPKSNAGNHLSIQLIKSGTSPALHYGEAQSGESSKDFIHKMKLVLKELRETFNNLRIIRKLSWLQSQDLHQVIDENNQLISIFVKSILTAQKNSKKITPENHKPS